MTTTYEVVEIDRAGGKNLAKMECFDQRDELIAVGTHVMRWARKLHQTAGVPA